jgi:rod shape-determining protein MreC
MQEDNEKLLLENNRLLARNISLQEMKNENDVLREQLRLLPRDKFDLEASFVIGQDPQGLGNWLTIGKGSRDGIAIGMPVIVSEGILVGRIDEVGPNYSRVNLITNTTSAINALDLETSAKGLLRGSYALGIMMDMISQGDVINNGDRVITSGLGGELPRGLLIGNIQEVGVSVDKLFQQAVVVPAVKYRDLDMVFVIRD